MATEKVSVDSTPTVLVLLVILIILAVALVYFYKKLNADTNGQYTVQRMVFAPGGLRDRLRQGVGVVENRFGVHIWPQPRDDEENIGDNDEEGGDHDKQNDSYAEGEQQENDDGGDDSSDYSSVDLRERAKMQMEEKNEAEEEKEKQKEEKKEEEAAAGGEDRSKEVKNEEKVGLLVDLKPFTGSAIWSEESKNGNEGNDLTAL
ncbi:protein tyrosine phosphatase receptor type C-associated protein [Pseudorasbora parva]|uniref:protein tyrosine phosphatase receptor type C-associated protein n=1 Tax=Pseudorasbora parva TaxID=51549 RepID=UPI00351F0108